MAGRVQWPRQAGGEPTVYIEDGPCFQSGSRAFSHVLVGPSGEFNHEVFVPQRTKLWLCGSLLGPSGKIEYSGTATGMPFLAEGQGEVIIPRTEITLRRAEKPIDIPQSR